MSIRTPRSSSSGIWLLQQDAGLFRCNTATASMRLHGRMPSVATRAMVANSELVCIGVSGDGDTANIGMGQFKHVCRRNLQIVHIIENNGCYGLTKVKFSATADLNQHPATADRARPTTCLPPFDPCAPRRSGVGATFVARSFAGDREARWIPMLKAAAHAQGDRGCSTSSARA